MTKNTQRTEEWIKEKAEEFIVGFWKQSIGDHPFTENFIRTLLNKVPKPTVSRAWITLQCVEIVEEIVNRGAGNLGILQALELMLPVAFEKAGFEVKE